MATDKFIVYANGQPVGELNKCSDGNYSLSFARLEVRPDCLRSIPIVGKAPLRIGDIGPDVTFWQSFLGVRYTGNFDEVLDVATRSFQTLHGLKPDGLVGNDTITICKNKYTERWTMILMSWQFSMERHGVGS
jgi:hypothetical protein